MTGSGPADRVTDETPGAATGEAEPREPRQSRSRATRAALLSATIDLLANEGWQPTTVVNVARRAGVSRGAAQHHFPVREDLITASLEYMFTERVAEVQGETGDLPEGRDRVHAVVESMVRYYTGPLFKAALQVWTAAASDEQLRRKVLPLEARFSRDVFRLVAEQLDVDLAHEPSRRKLQTSLDLARGLGLADVLSDDSARRAKIVSAWADDLDSTLVRRSRDSG